MKTGIMVGLGETEDEVQGLLEDVAGAGVDVVTIGQYLRPSSAARTRGRVCPTRGVRAVTPRSARPSDSRCTPLHS